MCEDGIPHVLLLVSGGAPLEDVLEQADGRSASRSKRMEINTH
jgi:hypothetical protein